MQCKQEGLLMKEDGVTLVELLASIVIISIILISVISIFNLTMKSNRTAEEIIDATYVAQTEIEKIYAMSQKEKPNLQALYGSADRTSDEDWIIYDAEVNDGETFYLRILEEKVTESNEHGLRRFVVKVYEDSERTDLQAQMEHLLEWGADNAEIP